jgi:phosphoglycerate kinase
MGWKTLDDIDLDGKVVLTRVDLNVPVRDGAVADATRIERIVPTLRDILAAGGKPVLLAHFGRPKGKPNPEMSLRVVVPALEAASGVRVRFVGDCIGAEAESAVGALGAGEVLLLENTRFHPEEERNDSAFAAAMAALGDVYCNDAFSAAHRAHASTEGLARLLPSCAGRQMEAELRALEAALGQPERPLLAVIGGAKVSTKIAVLENLIPKVQTLVIGGAMANTFLAAQGHEVGTSLVEQDMIDEAAAILDRARAGECEIVLPTDVAVADRFEAGAERRVVAAEACPPDRMILDVGPETVARIAAKLGEARTVVWNGPLGAFEIPPFDEATVAAALRAGELTRAGRLISVAGGGDTVAALNAAGVADEFSYVSTAGGAFLEWLEGRELPGVAALGGKQ